MSKEKYKSDEKKLINEIKKIIVTKPDSKELIIYNPTDLPILKKERKSVVIRIDATRCAVCFENEEDAENEYQALLKGECWGFTPKVYGRRGTYVVMELMDSPTLAEYLENQALTKDMTQKLLQLLESFQQAGYTRIDQKPESIYVKTDGSLKVVNLRRFNKLPRKLFPKKLIKGMGKQVTVFLNQVKTLNPGLYHAWSNHHEFEDAVQAAKTEIRK